MLTPKHRALFAAAYSALLLRTPDEEVEPAPAALPGEQRNPKTDNVEPELPAPR